MDSKECPLCQSREVGRKWCKDYMLGQKTLVEVAAFFKMNPKDVIDHIDNHDIQENPTTGELTSPDFFMKQLLMQINYLRDWLSYTTTSGRNMSREDIQQAIALSKEIRQTVTGLAELQGRLANNKTVNINIENLNQKYLHITEFLINETCPECQKKVIDLMEEMDEANPKEIAAQ